MIQAISRHFLFPYSLYLKLKCNNLTRSKYKLMLRKIISNAIYGVEK